VWTLLKLRYRLCACGTVGASSTVYVVEFQTGYQGKYRKQNRRFIIDCLVCSLRSIKKNIKVPDLALMATDRQSWSLKLGIPDHPLPSLLQPHQAASSMHLLDIGSGNE
jgi:hypothetical protein